MADKQFARQQNREKTNQTMSEVHSHTGAVRSLCPESFEPEVPYQQSHEVLLYQADGSRVKHLGPT